MVTNNSRKLIKINRASFFSLFHYLLFLFLFLFWYFFASAIHLNPRDCGKKSAQQTILFFLPTGSLPTQLFSLSPSLIVFLTLVGQKFSRCVCARDFRGGSSTGSYVPLSTAWLPHPLPISGRYLYNFHLTLVIWLRFLSC